jgi:prepilin peptidase CpaA
VFQSSPWGVVAGTVFLALLTVAALWDLKRRRIPNGLVVVLGLAGLLFSTVSLGLPRGLVHGAGGALVGFALWTPLYSFKVLGAGDVKLFAASAAWLGPIGALEAALLSALAGGVLAACYLVWKGPLEGMMTGLSPWLPRKLAARAMPGNDGLMFSLPYGVALAAGAAAAGWYPGLLG